MNHNNIANIARITVLSFIFSVGIGYSFADWTPPSGSPPFNNVPPPVNVGSDTQARDGNLILNKWLVAGGIGIGKVPRSTESLDVNGSVSVNNHLIHEVATPIAGKDAVNKDYVDAAAGGGGGGGGSWQCNAVQSDGIGLQYICINSQTAHVCEFSGPKAPSQTGGWKCFKGDGQGVNGWPFVFGSSLQ